MRGMVALVAAIPILAACASAGGPLESDVLSREEAASVLSGSEVVLAISSTIYESDSSARAWVAFIDGEGKVRFLPTDPQDGMRVTAAPGEVAWASTTTNYLLGDGQAEEWVRGGTQDTGHWAGFTSNRRPVSVMNTGVGQDGYITDVYAGRPGDQTHSVIPDVPGAIGLLGETLWMLNSGSSTMDGKVSAYRVDTNASDSVTKAFSYTHAGVKEGASYNEASDLFNDRGRLCHLEELEAEGPDGELGTFADGFSTHLNLACIDPTKERYESTFVKGFEGGVTDTADEPVSAALADAGHLHAGAIHRIVSDGTVLSVDLSSGAHRAAAQLSDEAMAATVVVVAWHGDRLRLLLLQRPDGAPALLETYDIDSGEQLTDVEVPALGDLSSFPGNPVAWSMAVVQPAR